MTQVLWTERKSNLSALIDRPGGISIGFALGQAKSNLQALEGKSRTLVLARIAELAALAPPNADAPATRQLQQAYALASEIIAAAGPFDRNDLCQVAKGLCDLIDAIGPKTTFDWRIVTVHAQALQLIAGLRDDQGEARSLVMANLRQMVERKSGASDQPVG